jgi:Na+-driven multidrug efflux pump
MPPTLFCSACTAMLNGMGNSKTPMFISVCCQILNIILDILAVPVLGFGVEGAAVASLISVVISMVWTYHHLHHALAGLSSSKPALETDCLRQYVPLAVPSVLQQSIMSVGSLLLQVLVNVAGVAYINGYNVACTLNNLFLLPVISCCVGYETFAAQNLGAKNTERVKKGFLELLGAGFVLCLVLSLLTCLLSRPLIGLYLTDQTSTSFQFARTYLLLLIPNYLLLLAKYSVDGLFKAQMKVYLFTISSLIALACRIAFGYLLSPSMGLTALAYATLLGNLIAVIFNWVCLLTQCRKS